MSKRYIDIDSSYRNRDRFPNPAQFDILISQTGRRSTVYNSIDPVASATIIFPPPNLHQGATFNSYSWMYSTSMSPLTLQIDGIVVNSSNTAVNYLAPSDAENFYINKYIENISDGSLRKITDYHTSDVVTHFDTGLVDVSMTSADNRILILGANTIPFTFHSDITNYYVGKKVTVGPQTTTIVAYNPSDAGHGGLPVLTVTPNWKGDAATLGASAYTIFSDIAYYVTIESQFSGGAITSIPPVTDGVNETRYRIRGDLPYEVGTIVSGTLTTFTLPLTSYPINDYYNGMFLWITNDTYYLIVDYVGATRTGTISSHFSPILAGGEEYNIMQFSQDNFSPMVYTGSQVSEQQMVCYEVELVSLILPNLVLSSGFGNLIAFYPYVYVEFANITGMNSNIIYSNNPFANRALFKVPVDDVNTPRTSSFISIDGHTMVQTVKFKPYDNFRVSVILPNGELFMTEEMDYLSPAPPNPNVQMSITFSIKRLEVEPEMDEWDAYNNNNNNPIIYSATAEPLEYPTAYTYNPYPTYY